MLERAYRVGVGGLFAVVVVLALLAPACGGSGGDVILATTTSTENSGLLDALVPVFEDQTDYNLQVIPVGTGQALEMGRRGDADVLLVHAPSSEEQFVGEGYGTNRQLVMHNDFVILGPADDPAAVGDAGDALEALQVIAESGSPFISRGDDSGTHQRELALWEELGTDPTGESWYEETGQGMANTLQVANQRNAYTVSDRGTFLSQSENLDLVVLNEGDPRLLNIYHVMQVNPEEHPEVNADGAEAFVEFMVSDEAQAIIEDFGVDEFDQPLFIPDAGRDPSELEVP